MCPDGPDGAFAIEDWTSVATNITVANTFLLSKSSNAMVAESQLLAFVTISEFRASITAE